MIFTLTMNPSLDRYLYVDKLIEDDAVRVKKYEEYAAGKGIDVSRVIKEIGGTSIAISPLGGENGEKISFMLDKEKVLYAAIRVKSETRMNIIVQTPKKQYRMSLPGQSLLDAEFSLIMDMIDATIRKGDTLVASGSLPEGFSSSVYDGIVKSAKSKGIKVYVDADGENLKAAVKEGPNGIKPNVYELSRLLGRKLETDEIPNALREINKLYGIEEILVTLGKKGAIVFSQGKLYKIDPVDVKVMSTVGAGDSFLAGFVYKREESLMEALKLAAACSTATVMTPGTTLCLRETVEMLKDKVNIEEI